MRRRQLSPRCASDPACTPHKPWPEARGMVHARDASHLPVCVPPARPAHSFWSSCLGPPESPCAPRRVPFTSHLCGLPKANRRGGHCALQAHDSRHILQRRKMRRLRRPVQCSSLPHQSCMTIAEDLRGCSGGTWKMLFTHAAQALRYSHHTYSLVASMFGKRPCVIGHIVHCLEMKAASTVSGLSWCAAHPQCNQLVAAVNVISQDGIFPINCSQLLVWTAFHGG